MAKLFDPRKVLKQVSNELLRRFFNERGELTQLAWEELSETQVQPIYFAWSRLPEPQRVQVQILLQDVYELSDERGLQVLADELDWRCPEKLAEFAVWESRLDKAMWVYLEARDVFDEAAIFARADALHQGRYSVRWMDHPTEVTLTITPELLAKLEQELCDFYWNREMRGRHCRVEHYQRLNGAEYFFAYLDDWPDKLLVFDESGEMVPRAARYAFSVIFIYCPETGALDLIAKGGKKVRQPLRQAFCRAVLGYDVDEADPDRPVYRLDHFLSGELAFPTDPEDQIAEVHLTLIRIAPRNGKDVIEHMDIRFVKHARPDEVAERIADALKFLGVSPGQASGKKASLQIEFLTNGTPKSKTMTFNVSCPNSCDLKSKPDPMRVVGERCLRLFGITDA